MRPQADGSHDFHSLSLKDLVQARDLFHYHLMNKQNVVGTALGLHRFRKREDWPSAKNPDPRPRAGQKKRRTLFNSQVRPYSWPCVYVFVSSWEEEAALFEHDPSSIAPRYLYLPDGRVVPVCVIETRKQERATDLRVNVGQLTPRNLLGPGTPLLNDSGQGMTRLATAGCLVRDGERYYVLTNRHAVGAQGTAIDAIQASRRTNVGVSASKGLTREDFGEVYPHFASTNQYLLMDVGLVDLEDITQWRAEFSSFSPVDNVLDLYDNAFDLHLVGRPVVGMSAVTGLVRGEIHGLFYRYKTMGGFEYISDFLIGPETQGPSAEARKEEQGTNVSFDVHHGDSGTVLLIEEPAGGNGTRNGNSKHRYVPFALLWGKEDFTGAEGTTTHPFALATALSTAFQHLDLDMVRGLNIDQPYIWGWVGHYLIGRTLPICLATLPGAKLATFIGKNLGSLAIDPDADLSNDPRVFAAGATDASHPSFVALADVPDNVWKSGVNFYQTVENGANKRHAGLGSRGRNDNPNHFADLDLPYKGSKTFLEYVLADLDHRLDPQVWLDYYGSVKPKYEAWAKALGKPFQPHDHWGALPFRIWQLFDAMVAATQGGDQDTLLCAGGVLIHYVGDACQPLHTSYLSQGDPDRLVDRPRSPGKKLEADGVHTGYEDDMVAYGFQEQKLRDRLEAEIKRQDKDAKEALAGMKDGRDAAMAAMRLIQSTHLAIPPRDIVHKWVQLKGTRKADRSAAMWEAFGDETIVCMARGSRVLTRMWSEAWKLGGGDTRIGAGTVSKEADLMRLYDDPNVLPSVSLDHYAALLQIPQPTA